MTTKIFPWCQVRAVWRCLRHSHPNGYNEVTVSWPVWGLTLTSRNGTSLKRTHDPFRHTASLKRHRVARYVSALTVVPHSTNSQAAPPQNPTTRLPSPYQQRVTPGLTVSLCRHSFQELSGSEVVRPSYVTCNDIAQEANFHIHASLPSRKRSSRNMFSGHLHTFLHQAVQISCSCSWLTTVSCTTPHTKPKCVVVWCKATFLFLWINSSITVVSHSTLKVLACHVYHR
jgi:hypothetical protein